MEFLFSHDKFLQGKILPRSPLPSPPSQQKIILKRSVHFQIIITVCKRWSKFVTCSPSPGDCGGVSQPKRHSYYVFWLCWTKWLSQNFDPLTLGKKMSVGGGLGALQFFWSLKKGTRTFNFQLEWALSQHFRTTWSIRSPLGKKKQTNKHAPVIGLLAKNTKFHIFVDRSLKLLQ